MFAHVTQMTLKERRCGYNLRRINVDLTPVLSQMSPGDVLHPFKGSIHKIFIENKEMQTTLTCASR